MEIAEAERSAGLAAQLEVRAGSKVEAGRIARRDRAAAFAIVAFTQRPRDEQGDARAQRIFADRGAGIAAMRSEEHTSELQSLMRISYAVFCLKKKTQQTQHRYTSTHTNNT